MSESAQLAELHRLLRLPEIKPVEVLEAGGGSASYIQVPAGSKITCIDISPVQLARNNYAHEKLLGDLQAFDYGPRSFDLVVCWNVLEHLQDPGAAVDRLVDVMRPGARIIIGGPLITSAKGLVTKFSPHFLHVWFHRHVLGRRNAGKPGYAPFPAYMRLRADLPGLEAHLQGRGLQTRYSARYQSSHLDAFAARRPALHRSFLLACAAVQFLTRGKYGSADTDFCLVMSKPERPSA